MHTYFLVPTAVFTSEKLPGVIWSLPFLCFYEGISKCLLNYKE